MSPYRYECSGLRRTRPPSGAEEPLADRATVVVLPDAGLVAATVQGWILKPYAGYPTGLRTPFPMLVPYQCDELRSLPHDDLRPDGCALDEPPLDLRTTQGCAQEGRYCAAVGRTCSYPDWDISAVWEQWSIDVPGVRGVEDAFLLESSPDEQWQMTVPTAHRDQRCATPPATGTRPGDEILRGPAGLIVTGRRMGGDTAARWPIVEERRALRLQSLSARPKLAERGVPLVTN